MANNSVEKYQPGVKSPVVKAAFDLELAKHNYQALLQNLSAVTITRDNVNDDLTKSGREVLKTLELKKDELAKEPLQWHRDVMENYKSLKNPLEEQVSRILAEKKSVADQINKEAAQQLAEKTRIVNAQAAIPAFTNKIANLIQSAKTDADIVSIEKMIGSEKTKTSVYQEFIPQLIEQCDALRPDIKSVKETIRERQIAEENEKKAMESGDIHAATSLREQREHLEAVIEETGLRIHEKAYEKAAAIEIIVPEVMDTAPKGRTNWKWRVDDIKMLQKKMPHLVKLVPDDDAINTLLATKRLDGSLKDKMEEKLFGLTFFNDKSYTK